jgi:HK97 family phage major capsid protein
VTQYAIPRSRRAALKFTLLLVRAAVPSSGIPHAFPQQSHKTEKTKMSNIKSARQRCRTQQQVLKNILAVAERDARELSDAEATRYDGELKKLVGYERALELEEHALELERGGTGVLVGSGSGEDLGQLRNTGAPVPFKAKGRRYVEMFGATNNAGFKDLNEFLKVIHSNSFGDPRIAAAAQGMSEGVFSDGGALVPTEFSAQLLDASLESEIVRSRATVYPMTSATKIIAGLDNSDNSGSAPYGGLSLQWAAEAASANVKKAKTRTIQLTAQKGMIFSYATSEVIADGLNFDQIVGGAIVKALGWGLDYAFLNGDGAGKPKGVLTDPALIVVAKESSPSQPANTVWYQNIVNMFSRLHPGCLANAVWVVNPSCLPQLLRMQITVMNVLGTENVGGSAVPVFSTNGGDFRLLGKPVLLTEKLPALSSQGDILLADFSQFAVGIRKEITLDRSIAPGFQTDEVAYRCIVRVDGQGLWKSAFTPKNGSTLSWCVALGAR